MSLVWPYYSVAEHWWVALMRLAIVCLAWAMITNWRKIWRGSDER